MDTSHQNADFVRQHSNDAASWGNNYTSWLIVAFIFGFISSSSIIENVGAWEGRQGWERAERNDTVGARDNIQGITKRQSGAGEERRSEENQRVDIRGDEGSSEDILGECH
ncbi:hypothetical protein BUALT_Bualt06G0083300 [Buddleja alternifolia]|uniref:Glycine-rich protein n=1 Tax=Buddleja alternifolia TaxID=168488 RepID=A0AAV6XDT2_9LAMI|nr:hypothetical protein BUALT_Bualt06G0083300 [Buddleja alternifolia]